MALPLVTHEAGQLGIPWRKFTGSSLYMAFLDSLFLRSRGHSGYSAPSQPLKSSGITGIVCLEAHRPLSSSLPKAGSSSGLLSRHLQARQERPCSGHVCQEPPGSRASPAPGSQVRDGDESGSVSQTLFQVLPVPLCRPQNQPRTRFAAKSALNIEVEM